jgi:hypothetical protein
MFNTAINITPKEWEAFKKAVKQKGMLVQFAIGEAIREYTEKLKEGSR